jgi:hypothetical protein
MVRRSCNLRFEHFSKIFTTSEFHFRRRPHRSRWHGKIANHRIPLIKNVITLKPHPYWCLGDTRRRFCKAVECEKGWKPRVC